MKYILVLLSFLFIQAADKPYCSCVPLSLEKKIDLAEYIFRGKVISIDTLVKGEPVPGPDGDDGKPAYFRPVGMIVARIKVVQSIKGNLSDKFVNVYSSWECCICGFSFLPNMEYLVFTNLDSIRVTKEPRRQWDRYIFEEDLQRSQMVLQTDICSGTDEFIPENLKEIRKYLTKSKSSKKSY